MFETVDLRAFHLLLAFDYRFSLIDDHSVVNPSCRMDDGQFYMLKHTKCNTTSMRGARHGKSIYVFPSHHYIVPRAIEIPSTK